LMAVTSSALCVVGPNLSSIAGNILRDKMGFGLYPKEQLHLLKKLHKWKETGKRDLVLIGGDLHIGIKTEVRYEGNTIFYQYITTPMREEPPTGLALSVFKTMMETHEDLKHGYTFRHLSFKPERNFGYAMMKSAGNPETKMILCHRPAGKPMKKFLPGELIITNMSASHLQDKHASPFLHVKVLGVEGKTGSLKDTLNPNWNHGTLYLDLTKVHTSQWEKDANHLAEIAARTKGSTIPRDLEFAEVVLEVDIYCSEHFHPNELEGRAFVNIDPLCAFINTDTPFALDPRTKTFTNIPLHDRRSLERFQGAGDLGTVSFTVTFVPQQG